MNELMQSLQQKIGLTETQAADAVSHVMDYFKSKLPESLHGHLDGAVSGAGHLTEEIKSKAEGLLSSVKDKLHL